MITRDEFKKLLSKGLTGKEAGKLVLQDNWLADHDQESLLSERDLQAIKTSLKSSKDIEDYNSYIATYRFIDYTLKDARIRALEARVRLDAITSLIRMRVFNEASELENDRPVIMTQKQYQDALDYQRKYLLRELSDLHDILEMKAIKLSPEDIRSQEPRDSGDYLDWLRTAYPDLWSQAVSKVLEVLKAGKLRPVSIPEEGRKSLDALWDKIKELQAELPIHKIPREEYIRLSLEGEDLMPDRALSDQLKALDAENEDLLQDLYKAGRKSWSKESRAELISSLERYLAGSMSEEEELQLLYYAFCSGEELYKSGLSEWKEWVDNYKWGYVSSEDYPYSLGGVAILADPRDSQLDSKGYYKPELSRALDDQKEHMVETIGIGIRKLKEELKIVLSFLSVMEAVSQVIGIDFAEDIRGWIKDLQDQLKIYNRLRSRVCYQDYLPEKIRNSVQPISLEKLRPSSKTIRYLQERMALGLGEGWWEDVKMALVEDLKEKEAEDGQEA